MLEQSPEENGWMTMTNTLRNVVVATYLDHTVRIRAAKANAQRHRDADSGGEGLSLLNESRRRHGMDKRLQGGGNTITELASEAKSQLLGSKKKDEDTSKEHSGSGRSENEERLREMRWKPREKGVLESLREDEIPIILEEWTGDFHGYAGVASSGTHVLESMRD